MAVGPSPIVGAPPIVRARSTPHPMVPAAHRVLRVGADTHDTYTLELDPGDGRRGFAFAPGQFNMLYAFGVGEVPVSISGDPASPATVTHTVRAVGAVSRALTGVRAGQMLGVRGPFGTAWPLAQAEDRDVLIIAGGIGLAPLRPALYALLARRDRFRRITLLYGTRTPADLLYREELHRWRGRFDLDVEVTVDAGDGDWRGQVGVVTALIGRAAFEPQRSVALLCGPEVMLRFAVRALLACGLPIDAAYVSLERNMKCAVGHCGHCQFGPEFMCKDGPVFRYDRIAALMGSAEL